MSHPFHICKTEFITSAPDILSCPETQGFEIAVAGRSNVGKSSLLNLLTNRKKLAKVSSTPGRTRLLNFFRVSFKGREALSLVDLPGYGFAKLPETMRLAFGPMVHDYLSERKSLALLVLLIDLRRDPKKEEKQIVEFAAFHNLPLLVLTTKADEIPKSKRFPRLSTIRKTLSLSRFPVLTSAKEKMGRQEAWSAIFSLLPPKEPQNKEGLAKNG